jgi:uncharacterized protein (TIGR03546 family)
MFWLKYVQGLIKTLNENTSPREIAGGVVLGSLLGFLPKTNLLSLFIWIVILMVQVNIGMATAAIIFFAIVGHLTDPFVEKLGFWVLTGLPGLKGFWTALYNTPIIPFSNFNNTLVMGNLLFGLILAIPLYFATKRGVVIYRERYRDRILRWKLIQAVTATQWFQLYQRWSGR